MKTPLLAALVGVALAAVAPAGCDRLTDVRQPASAPAAATVAPTVSTPAMLTRGAAPASEPRPAEAAWAAYFQALAAVARPCDTVMNSLARAPRGRDPAAIRQLARSAESACFAASGGYGAVAAPTPLPPAGRRDLERGVATLSKGYLGRSLGLNALATETPDSDAAAPPNPEADQTLGHAQDDIVAARAGLLAVARRYGYARIDAPAEVEAADPSAQSVAPAARPVRRAVWRPRGSDGAAAHRTVIRRWRAQDRPRWRPPPYPRYAAPACDLGSPLSPRNCAHAWRKAEAAEVPPPDEARPRHCRRFWIFPCRLFGRGAG